MTSPNILGKYSGKNVLVTGGAGCIGSNLIRSLLESEAKEIVVLDDLSSSSSWNLPRDSRISFIRGSIPTEEDLARAFSMKPDIVFHLAAHFANQNSVDHPQTDLMVNGLGTQKVLQHAEMVGVESLVFASSGCSVYGSEAPLPLEEDYVSLHLDSPYQIHKLLGELYCNFFSNHYGLPIVRARFFNVYGPGEIPGIYRNVIPNFTWWALRGEKLPITGTGEETRDFTFVGDAVDGLMSAAIHPKAVGEAINIASGTETRIIDLARMINEVTGNESGVEFITKRSWDRIYRRRASIEKGARLIGYEPRIQIGEGLKSTVDWFLRNEEKIATAARF